MSPEQTTNEYSTEPRHWPFAAKTIASLLVSIHLFAVFASPWSGPGPASDLAAMAGRRVSRYTQALAIDNGYRYFAPDPGVSHVIRYTFTNEDGTATKGQFPNKEAHWPRLLYHRHLMLSEMVSQLIIAAPDLPPELLMGEDERKDYEWRRQRARLLLESLANQLLASNPDAKSVELVLHAHEIPTPTQVLNGLKLTDEKLYDAGTKLGIFPREPS